MRAMPVTFVWLFSKKSYVGWLMFRIHFLEFSVIPVAKHVS